MIKKLISWWFCMSGSMPWVVGRLVIWPISKNRKKTKVVALHCSFLNQFELCSKVLRLWRYDISDFPQCSLFVFCIFLNENNIKWHNINTVRKLRDRATIIILGENWPQKEGVSPRVNDTDRQQEITDTPQKSVYIAIFVFTTVCIQPDSSSISISVWNPVESTGIWSHSTGLHWIPLDSARMTGVWL